MTKRTLSKLRRHLDHIFVVLSLIQTGKWNREEGEGVISTAIVVLIVAFLAVGMWIAFKAIMGQTTNTISSQVSQLGQ
jgi:hypothetical protein